MSKKKNMRKHFQLRSLQRVGVILDENKIVKAIQNQELEFIERQSNRVTVWRYKFNGETYRVCYDSNRKQIITILFEAQGENNG